MTRYVLRCRGEATIDSASRVSVVLGTAARGSGIGASASTPTTRPGIVGVDADAPIQHLTQ